MAGLIEETYSPFEQAYDFFNQRLFDSSLPQCIITFQRQNRLMGYASFKRWINDGEKYVDELAINPEYFANFPLVEIFQTLCHEMVHIWQEHHGTPSRRGYHNKEWAQKMIAIGLMPSTTGMPGGDTVGEKVMDYVIEDGKFITFCDQLIDSGFSIKWFDTFPIPNRNAPSKQYLKHKNALHTMNSTISSSLIQNEEIPDFPFSITQLDNALAASMAKATQVMNESVFTPASTRVATTRPRKSSAKNKYYCASCFAQVWGKSGLNVVCGNCNQTLIETD